MEDGIKGYKTDNKNPNQGSMSNARRAGRYIARKVGHKFIYDDVPINEDRATARQLARTRYKPLQSSGSDILERSIDITDGGKRIQQAGLGLRKIKEAIRIIEKNDTSFSAPVVASLGAIAKKIDTMQGKKELINRADIDELKQMLKNLDRK